MWIGLFQPRGFAIQQPAQDDMVDGAVPGVRRHPRVKWGDLSLGDRGIEAVGNECGKRRVQFIELRVEFFPAPSASTRSSRQEAVACESMQHFTQRGVAAPKGIGLFGHRASTRRNAAPHSLHPEREEQGLLAREMKVEATFGRIRGAGDLVDRGVAVAVLGEDPSAASSTRCRRVRLRSWTLVITRLW